MKDLVADLSLHWLELLNDNIDSIEPRSCLFVCY